MLLLSAAGAIRGPLAVILLIMVWVFLPSAPGLSRRLALSGAVALGVIPVLWWVKWPVVAGLSHSGLILSVLCGVLVFLFVDSRQRRKSLLPSLSRADIIPAAGALFAIWFFLPFATVRSGIGSVAMLINGWGNDNVAHFAMFSMIRRALVTGPGWEEPPGGSPFAYTNYPQHFHVLVAFAAELLHGPALGSIGTETGLYGLGTALVISGAVVTLLAAIASCPPLRGRPAIAVIVGAGVISFTLLGMGSNSLSFGFPGFLLAIIGTLIACVIAFGVDTAGRSALLATAALLVLVAHTWSLLTPMAVVPFVFVLVRFLRRAERRSPVELLAPGIIVVLAVAGVGYAGLLVYRATHTIGSVASVLAIAGGFPPVSVELAAVIAVTAIGVAGVWAAWPLIFRRSRAPRAADPLFAKYSVALVAATVIVGSAEAIGLVAVQLRQSPALSYYQFKFIFGITIIFAVLLLVLVGALLARWLASRRGSAHRWREALFAGLITVQILGASTYIAEPHAVPTSAIPPGVIFRTALQDTASAPPAMTARILEASTIMRSHPCRRPVYLSLLSGDPRSNESNQWALSFSGTWTVSDVPVNALLAHTPVGLARADPSSLIEEILSADSHRCVIASQQVVQKIDSSIARKFGRRILSLGE